jgi:peroxiredoxin Q/BCP
MANLAAGRKAPDFTLPTDDGASFTLSAALGAKVVGISPDSIESHCRFRDKHGLAMPLAADPDHKVIQRYGAWGPKKMFGHAYDGVIRTSVLVDARGKVAKIWKVTRIKGHAEAVLEEVRRLVG